jgi:hypothetical protein
MPEDDTAASIQVSATARAPAGKQGNGAIDGLWNFLSRTDDICWPAWKSFAICYVSPVARHQWLKRAA